MIDLKPYTLIITLNMIVKKNTSITRQTQSDCFKRTDCMISKEIPFKCRDNNR